jgi:predicted nucleic acid-binding protein
LAAVFAEVLIPLRVFEEAQKELRDRKALDFKWLVVGAINDQNYYSIDQRRAMAITMRSFEYVLDDGEREAIALANELGIPIILSDDRKAKRIIEAASNVVGLSCIEVLVWATDADILESASAQEVFQAINSVVDHPIGTPYDVLQKQARDRFRKLGWGFKVR